jgi:Phage portal protein
MSRSKEFLRKEFGEQVVFLSEDKKYESYALTASAGRGRESVGTYKTDSLEDSPQQPFFLPATQLYQPWGFNNRFPQSAVNLLEKNPFAETAISTIVDFITGRRYVLYKEKIVNGQIQIEYINNPEIEDWLTANDFQTFHTESCIDYVFTGNLFIEAITSKSGNKIAQINRIDPTLIRIGQFKSKAIDYLVGDWNGFGQTIHETLPAYDKANPFANTKSIIQIKRYRPGTYRYGKPHWIGAEKSIELTNKIPDFHLNGLENGYVLRWHIKFPKSYFTDNYDASEQEQAEAEVRRQMNDFLAGSKNAGKAFISRYSTDGTGKMKDGIIIEPLKPELLDNAYSVAFDQGMITLCSAFGINPELAGIIPQGKMSGNSGSGIRNAHNEYVNLKAPTWRDYTLKIFDYIKAANGWDKDVKIGVIDHHIEKLDDNPAGSSMNLNNFPNSND